MNTQNRFVTVAFICLFSAIGISIYLTLHHYDLIYGLRNSKSICNISSAFDCDAVNASFFSEIWGIPVALLSALAYAVELLFLLGVRALGEEEKAEPARFFFYLSWFNVLMTLYMGTVSTFILKNFCLFCMSLYVISFVVLACAYKIRPKNLSWKILTDDIIGLVSLKHRGALFLLLSVPVGGVLLHSMYSQSVTKDLDTLVQHSLSDWRENRKIDFFIQRAPQIGNPQARFQLIEFSDFECPHCKRASPSLQAFVMAHKQDVQLTFQCYPLDTSCNPYVKNRIHDKACILAKAALCAQQQGRFRDVHDWIFDHQEGISEELFPKMIEETKLDKQSFDQCLGGSEVAKELGEQIERGHLAGIQGTPSIFANGRLLPGGFMIPVLEGALKDPTN